MAEALARKMFGDDLAAPVTVGRYVVLGRIGAGAAGVVYRAYDPDLEREVAIKVLAPTSSSRERDTMLREGRALAKVSHPNVVVVHEVGTIETGVFLVMELVQGRDLADWLREHDPQRRGHWQQVLPILRGAAAGLRAIHSAGIVHRDLKPSNVLVTRTGEAKVADFGLARASSADMVSAPNDSDGSTVTSNWVGTPAYMAPEQHAGAAATPSTDVFSFCVMAWELLAGQRPWPRLADVDAPPPDAQVLGHVPAWLREVIQRGLRLDSNQRWRSAIELSTALQREPVRVGRAVALASVGVVGVGLAVAIPRALDDEPCAGASKHIEEIWNDDVALALRSAFEATAFPAALDQFERVRGRVDEFATAWVGEHRQTCEATAVRREQSSEVLDLRMACLRRAKVSLEASLATLMEADRNLVARALDLVPSPLGLRACEDVDALRLEVPLPPDPEVRAEVDAVSDELARVQAQFDAGRFASALELAQPLDVRATELGHRPLQARARLLLGRTELALLRVPDARTHLSEAASLALEGRVMATLANAQAELSRALVQAERLDEADAAAALTLATARGFDTDGRQLAMALNVLALLAERRGRYDEALRLAEESLAIYRRLDDPRGIVQLRNNIAATRLRTGDPQGAVEEQREAIDAFAATFGPSHPELASKRRNFAFMLHSLGRSEEALAQADEALRGSSELYGPRHVQVAKDQSLKGLIYKGAGEFAESERAFLAALEIALEAAGEESLAVAELRMNYAGLLGEMRRHAESAQLFESALPILLRHLGETHAYVAGARCGLALESMKADRVGQAEALARQCLASLQDRLGPRHLQVELGHSTLGQVLKHLGRADEAVEQYRLALDIRSEAMGADSPSLAQTHNNLGNALAELDRDDEAIAAYRRAIELWVSHNGDAYPHANVARLNLAELLLNRRQVEEATSLLETAWSHREVAGIDDALRAKFAFLLARAREASGRRTEALALAREAEKTFEADPVRHADDLAEVRRWLARR